MTGSAPLDRERLARVLALLASPSDGEALAAARAADRMVRRAGLAWAQVIVRDDSSASVGIAAASYIDECLSQPRRLTEWEARFLRSLRRWSGPLSTAQRATLDGIVARLRGAPRSAAA